MVNGSYDFRRMAIIARLAIVHVLSAHRYVTQALDVVVRCV